MKTESSTEEHGRLLFIGRLVCAFRDGVLGGVSNPKDVCSQFKLPETELGIIADLNEAQRISLQVFLAKILDQSLNHFLYGLDDKPDGLDVTFNGESLCNGNFALSTQAWDPQILSQYDGHGIRNSKQTRLD